jgi:predicted nucleotidyltransferase
MRFHGIPERLLQGETAIRVLQVMLGTQGREMTGRQVARLARAPPQRAIERLHQLEAEGLVERRLVGRSHVWRLVETHVLVEALSPLLSLDGHAQGQLRRALTAWVSRQQGVVQARLYGSIARGDERALSDVDVLLVVKDARAKRKAGDAALALDEEIQSRFGNPANVIVLTRAEWNARRGKGFVGSAESEGEPLALAPS